MDFYEATAEHVTKLSGPWCASFSGGKDSSSLVTWVEWMRRTGQIEVKRPQLVQCDTLVEYPELAAVGSAMMDLLRSSGWECAVVIPDVDQRLYNRILGIGNTPVHPGGRKMRWCTRATKIDPMEHWRSTNSSGLVLTGLRLGESDIRDEKLLKKSFCAAGGECGIPEPTENTYSPIINWQLCQVIDWLQGTASRRVNKVIPDILKITGKLIDIYNVSVKRTGFDWSEPIVTASRYGCIGCPAIGSEREAPPVVVKRHGKGSPLNELYDVWFEARRRDNRCIRHKEGKDGRGPIRMAVRQVLFARVIDIQQRAGIVLIRPEDEEFIRQCWADKRYPRGWSEADEDTQEPALPLF